MRADSIASQGKVGKVSALSVASFGRLYRYLVGVIPPVIIGEIVEVWNLVSRITRVLSLQSRVD